MGQASAARAPITAARSRSRPGVAGCTFARGQRAIIPGRSCAPDHRQTGGSPRLEPAGDIGSAAKSKSLE